MLPPGWLHTVLTVFAKCPHLAVLSGPFIHYDVSKKVRTADEHIVFDPDHEGKWQRALGKLGIDLSLLSSDAGHA